VGTPTCHNIYGANPQKRKFIREARDLWFEICERRYAADNEHLVEVKKMLRGTASRQDLEQFKDDLFLVLNSRLGQSAIDSMVEGWVRAIGLRTREKDGHTRRVAELTLKMARSMGVPEEELAHVYRGALLHDIGKMGVADYILFKPGKLTPQEWRIIQQHPVYAYEILSPIPEMLPAIDIPYCHHERWNGEGFPRRLKGEEIPLAARIFAVADVWEALRYERTYK